MWTVFLILSLSHRLLLCAKLLCCFLCVVAQYVFPFSSLCFVDRTLPSVTDRSPTGTWIVKKKTSCRQNVSHIITQSNISHLFTPSVPFTFCTAVVFVCFTWRPFPRRFARLRTRTPLAVDRTQGSVLGNSACRTLERSL